MIKASSAIPNHLCSSHIAVVFSTFYCMHGRINVTLGGYLDTLKTFKTFGEQGMA